MSTGDDFSATVQTTGTVAVGGTTKGEINVQPPGDQDWFKVELDAGKTYRIDVKGADYNYPKYTLLDPVLLGLYDSNGAFIDGTFDDNSGKGHYDSLKLFKPGTDGTYYVAVGAARDGQGPYGVTVTQELVDDFPAWTSTTGRVAVGGAARGEITLETPDWDIDWFKVELEEGKNYRVEVRGIITEDGTLTNPFLAGLYDARGAFIDGTGDDDSGTGLNSLLFFAPATSGAYYVAARARHNHETGTYTVAVTEEGEAVGDDFDASTFTEGAVAVGGIATGEITLRSPADHDWFEVDLETGKTYRIEVRGKGTGEGTLLDPVLVGLYDGVGAFITGTGDDNSGAGNNSLKIFTPTESGAYYVAARAHDLKSGTYTVAVTEEAAVAETTVDDDFAASTATTGKVAVGGTATGSIESETDQDWFEVDLDAGKTYRVEVRGKDTGDGSLPDPILEGLYDAAGAFIAGTGDDDSGAGANSLKLFTPAESGVYYVAASAYKDDTGAYTVAVADEDAPDAEPDAEPGQSGEAIPLFGGERDDNLPGTDGPDDLRGRNGADELRGMGGDDTLRGGPGRDMLHGGAGDDTLKGGPDDDALYGGGGNDTLDGGDGADTLQGGKGRDRLFGKEGRDELFGGKGVDTLYGGKGGDVLRGGPDNDRVYGEEGKDALYGGFGNDTLTGGPKADVFHIEGDGGRDVITDFDAAVDYLSFTDVAFADVAEMLDGYAVQRGNDTLIYTDDARTSSVLLQNVSLDGEDNMSLYEEHILIA